MVGVKIASSLYKQISQYIQYTEGRKTNIPAICLQDVIQYALDFCGNQKSEEELRTKLVSLKYILSIEFTENGICYKVIRNGVHGERIRLIYSGVKAKKERDIWLQRLHKQEIRMNHSLVEQIDDKYDIRISSRDMIRLFEETVHRNDVYVSEKIRYRLDHLTREIPRALRIGGKDKNIFKFFSLLLLNIPDKVICDSSKEISTNVFMLETAFLQYFHIGSEETQEIKIMYDELLKM